MAVGLARMGQKTAVFSLMGEDTTRPLALEVLAREQVGIEFIQTIPDVQSSYSVVLNFKGEKTILTGHIEHEYHLPKNFPHPTWIYVAEMGHGYENLYKDVVEYAKIDGVKIAMNPGSIQVKELRKELYDLIAQCFVLFVNRKIQKLSINATIVIRIHRAVGANATAVKKDLQLTKELKT